MPNRPIECPEGFSCLSPTSFHPFASHSRILDITCSSVALSNQSCFVQILRCLVSGITDLKTSCLPQYWHTVNLAPGSWTIDAPQFPHFIMSPPRPVL